MLRIYIHNKQQQQQLQHGSGPLEFGRVGQKGANRIVLEDPFVSRDQLRIQERPGGRLAVENLSQRTPLHMSDGAVVGVGATAEFELPVTISVGATYIDVSAENGQGGVRDSWQTIFKPAWFEPASSFSLSDSRDALTPEMLAHWFETVISVQRSAAGSPQFYDETARAVVDLVGLDRALVLLRRGEDWEIVASHSQGTQSQPGFSRTILRRMVEEGRTFFRAVEASTPTGSLIGVEAVVVSPIFDPLGEVVGAVYGLRTQGRAKQPPAIQPLEAQLVQLLAAAVGAGLARVQREAEATRSRVQFEQFFSSRLAQELEHDPKLLDGRDCEITVLFSDIRGFSGLSERLGPAEVCRLVGDIMERLTARIVEHAGVVVDYIGDGLLAMWNAPQAQADHAAMACRAALAMLDELPALNAQWQPIVGAPLGLGIGLNTGPARVGNIGSRRRFKYGPLGHSVNLASRVESVTKHLGVPVLITGSTRKHLGENFATRRLCRAKVSGIAAPVELYELHAQEAVPEWRARRDAYEAGLAHFEAGRWAEACQTLYPLLTEQPGDYDVPSLTLVGRAIECLKSPPARFDPVLEFLQK
jgi:adenylate cyclase